MAAVLLALAGCGGLVQAREAVLAPGVIDIPAGPYIAGSDAGEREAAYRLDEKGYGHSVTRKQGWYDNEAPRRRVTLPAFSIAATPITNRQYLVFVRASGHRAPGVDARTWAGYRLIHPYRRTRKFVWKDGRPPAGRLDHPVVMVSHGDARAYA
ncbi:MAG: SUMF1/EgtB/PvdO family nonheme iron enzyme, partial [Alphaproteobacteria bacterium]